MATTALEAVLRNLRRTLLCQDLAGCTDAQLLDLFIARRDEAAFEALVGRHGPMVLGVCRRVLCNESSAEDAFQATFLVLVRKAVCVRPRAMVGNWLYGVAQTTALKARAMRSKRLAREREAAAQARRADSEAEGQRLQALLDQELKHLPAIYRSAIVLCDLEGNSQSEAGRRLGCPQATIGTRLARGRRLLARRLARHGLAVSSGLALSAMVETLRAASVPPTLMTATVNAARALAAGEAAAGAISMQVSALTEGVLKSMLLTKLKMLSTCLLAGGVIAAGAAWTGHGARAGSAVAAEPTLEVRFHEFESEAQNKHQPEKAHDKALEIRGSGRLATKEFALADFTSFEVSRTFQVEITRADAFRVSVTADDNLLPYIHVTKEGTELRLLMDPKLSFWATALKATVTMPALENLHASSASRVSFKGFKSEKPFKAQIELSSQVQGEIEAGNMDLSVSGGGMVMLKGQARELKLSGSQASRLSLAEFTAGSADVALSEASTAVLRVKDKLEYNLSRASRLEYLGNPPTTKGRTSDASSAVAVAVASPVEQAAGAAHGLHQGRHGGNAAGAAHNHHGAGAAGAGLNVGAKVPDILLQDLHGKIVKLSDLQKQIRETDKKAIVLSFWCSTCPSCRRVEHQLDKLAQDFRSKALVFALDANAGEKADNVGAVAKKTGLTLPIYLNPKGEAADLFGIEVTTTTVVIDADGVLRYCGRFNDGGSQAYAQDALQAVLAGKEVAVKTTRHDGCGIIRK
jgi:RNA polymerase sigma factor (sigma-70 family)